MHTKAAYSTISDLYDGESVRTQSLLSPVTSTREGIRSQSVSGNQSAPPEEGTDAEKTQQESITLLLPAQIVMPM